MSYISFVWIILIYPLLLIFPNSEISQSEFYKLKYFNSEFYFYNTVKLDENLLFGTSLGVLRFNDNNTFILQNEDIIGPIGLNHGEIYKAYRSINNSFNYLLPENYKYSLSTILFDGEYLYLINSGDLFIFEKLTLNFKSTGSVRSISENYIGTYEGIINRENDSLLKFPTYTSGYIREFKNATFILWDGLSVINQGNQKNYYDYTNESILLGDQLIGVGHDVVEIRHPKYLVSTSRGLFEIDIDLEKSTQILDAEEGTFSFIRTERNIFGLEIVYFYDSRNIYQYNMVTGEKSTIAIDIYPLSVFSESSSTYYILTKESLLYKHLKEPKLNQILIDNINGHSIGKLGDLIYILSDEGLSLYHLAKSGSQLNVLKNEFNRLAHKVIDDKLYLGGVSGIYVMDYLTLEQLYDNNRENNLKKDSSNLWWYLSLLVVFIFGLWTIWWQRRMIESKLPNVEIKSFYDTVVNIINEDIANTDINTICKRLNISTAALYEQLGEVKPGKLIRRERIKIVRSMRKTNASDHEIAKATGFSISYLKKI